MIFIKNQVDKADSAQANGTGVGGSGVHSGNDDCWPRAKSGNVDIVTSTYTN